MTAPATFAARDLCAEHRAEWDRWLDYRLPPAPVRLIVIGARMFDAQEARRLRFADWRATIAAQHGLILAACQAHTGVAQPTGPV